MPRFPPLKEKLHTMFFPFKRENSRFSPLNEKIHFFFMAKRKPRSLLTSILGQTMIWKNSVPWRKFFLLCQHVQNKI